MLNIVEINGVLKGSTGTITRQLAKLVVESGWRATVCVPKGRHNRRAYDGEYETILFGNRLSEDSHILLSRLTGFNGCFSGFATARLLKNFDATPIDVVHLHNLHNSYINLPSLFRYLKRRRVPVVWTLHDCWAFTGQCPYFTMARCDKWKTTCGDCPQFRCYPKSCVDRTKTMRRLKKEWFTGVENLTIVTPSQWLADLTTESFLKDYPVKVINNGIDLDVFKPTESDFRRRRGLDGKFIVLGVAFGWGARKGLDVFLELAKRFDDRYRIVLVGTDEATERALPKNVVSIRRTQNQRELAEIYSAADVFVNPTREENYPTVNMESLACGTPVVTFRTGGSPEILDATCGSVVDCDDVDAMEREIQRVCEEKSYSLDACLRRAVGFDAKLKFKAYLDLYANLCSREKRRDYNFR